MLGRARRAVIEREFQEEADFLLKEKELKERKGKYVIA